MRREAEGDLDLSKEQLKEDMLREGEIQELLDRPRVMPEPSVSRSATGSLHRRRVSTDVGQEIELSPRSPAKPTFRHSVDIAEVLGGSV